MIVGANFMIMAVEYDLLKSVVNEIVYEKSEYEKVSSCLVPKQLNEEQLIWRRIFRGGYLCIYDETNTQMSIANTL